MTTPPLIHCTCPQANHQHGDYLTYKKHGCKCSRCLAAHARQVNIYRRRARYDQQPRAAIDATTTREHLRYLLSTGHTYETVGIAAGVSPDHLENIGCGRHHAVYPWFEQSVTAVRPDPVNTPGRRDANSTRLRLQALARLGWSCAALARMAGVGGDETLTRLRSGYASEVTARTWHAVKAAYDDLWNTPPTPATRNAVQKIALVRNRAVREGWLLPMDLDDDMLDDPSYKPHFELVRLASSTPEGTAA